MPSITTCCCLFPIGCCNVLTVVTGSLHCCDCLTNHISGKLLFVKRVPIVLICEAKLGLESAWLKHPLHLASVKFLNVGKHVMSFALWPA